MGQDSFEHDRPRQGEDEIGWARRRRRGVELDIKHHPVGADFDNTAGAHGAAHQADPHSVALFAAQDLADMAAAAAFKGDSIVADFFRLDEYEVHNGNISMLIVYNIFQLLALIVFAPVLFVKVILTPKYRGRIPKRLGAGLGALVSAQPLRRPRIWIHALSLGEVTSSESLVKAVRSAMPEATIMFSAATRAGEQRAQAILQDHVDLFVPFPLDLWWSVRKFVTVLEPDLFLLIETDFWPNILHTLQARQIPSVLVNGRISHTSFTRYRRLRKIFLPLFDSFKFIAMQTEEDTRKMVELGLSPQKVRTLGNL